VSVFPHQKEVGVCAVTATYQLPIDVTTVECSKQAPPLVFHVDAICYLSRREGPVQGWC
jgi:hypothetical protein